MKEGLKLVIFASSIFDEANSNPKGPVRKVRWEIQQYGISIGKCRYCKRHEVTEKYSVPQQFLDSQRLLGVDMIQLSYPSSPRGVRKIVVDGHDYYNNDKGWGNYPSNLYIPVKERWLTIQEAMADIGVIAVNNQIEKSNLTWENRVGSIEAGNGGSWEFYINFPIERAEFQPEAFSHPSCVRSREFFLLDEKDIKNAKRYFEEVGEMYVHPSGREVLYKDAIYVPYLTTNKSLCLLERLGDKGVTEGNRTVSYRRYDDDKVMIYENEKFIDYASPCILEKKDRPYLAELN